MAYGYRQGACGACFGACNLHKVIMYNVKS